MLRPEACQASPSGLPLACCNHLLGSVQKGARLLLGCQHSSEIPWTQKCAPVSRLAF